MAAQQSVFILVSESQHVVYHELKSALEDIGFEVIVSSEGLFSVPTIDLSSADFAIAILDASSNAGNTEPHARQNLIFELGILVGIFGIDRVLLLTTGGGIESIDLRNIATRQISDTLSREHAVELAGRIKESLSLLSPRRAVEQPPYYSCFLSYSARDEGFVRKLASDLNVSIRKSCERACRGRRGGFRRPRR